MCQCKLEAVIATVLVLYSRSLLRGPRFAGIRHSDGRAVVGANPGHTLILAFMALYKMGLLLNVTNSLSPCKLAMMSAGLGLLS